MEQMNFVIVISGVPGSGKSTLVREIAQALGPAVTLHFDDYGATSVYPEDFKAWVQSGGDPNDWQTPQLVRDLQSLRAGVAVSHPRSQIIIEPQPVILVEEPFGRAREEINALVDFAAHISLPLDITLIRLLRRMMLEDEDCEIEKRQGCSSIVESLFCTYLDDGMRELFQCSDGAANRSADMTLDGLRTPQDLTDQLLKAVRPQIASIHPPLLPGQLQAESSPRQRGLASDAPPDFSSELRRASSTSTGYNAVSCLFSKPST